MNMKKLALTLICILFTCSGQCSLDNIIIPKITLESLINKSNSPYQSPINAPIERIVYFVEKKYNIPHGLLMAISLTESGRICTKTQKFVAWPWTINANGRSYFFNSKNEAIRKLHELQAAGISAIDVGCMQINLLHHPKAFKSPNEAFDPASNIEYAAKFLKSLYLKNNSWEKAVCHYHSQNRKHYQQYYCSVMKQYQVTSQKQVINDNVMYYVCYTRQDNNIDEAISKRLHKLGKMILAKNSQKSDIPHY